MKTLKQTWFFNQILKERKLAVLLVLSGILLVSFTACAPAATAAPTAEPQAAAPTEAAEEPVVEENPLIELKVGVSPVPHGDILRFIQESLAAEAGINLTIVEFTDYVQPNLALAEGELDANYFQHVPYLEDFSAEHGLDLTVVTAVHIEPLGLYSSAVESVADIPDGAVIAIPNDATNGGRALNLLQANGLLTLKEGVGTSATVQDIVDNPKNIEITELEAAQLPRALEDVTAAVINGNYAIDAGLKPAEDALALESGEDNPYANVFVVRTGDENNEGIQILAGLLNSPEVKKFIEDTYQGSVIPAFE